MRRNGTRVVVCSRSFSAHPVLRDELSRRYADVAFNEEGRALRGDALAGFLSDATHAIIGLEPIDSALLGRLPALGVISKYGVGLDRIDLIALEQRGVRLGWTGGVNRRAVAEIVVSHAINLLRGLSVSDAEVRAGRWAPILGRELGSSTVGVLGCGNVGKEVARLMRAFGCRVLAHDLLCFEDFYREHQVSPVSLDVLLAESDVLSLHLPLDASTRGILDRARLAAMRPRAVLINTARGGLVDEHALADQLRAGHLAGAAFDVFEDEPPTGSPLLNLPNTLCTAHLAGSSEQAVLAMGRAAIAGLESHAPASNFQR